MPQPQSHGPTVLARTSSAVRNTAAAFGTYAGVLGMEHGFFESLQGNTNIKGVRIMAVGGPGLPFPFGHEPAMTLIPNYLFTGIAAMLAGLAIVLWSAACLQSRYGAVVLLLLSVALLLVGGGFGPISLLIAACIAASRIGKPVPWGLKHLPPGVKRSLAQLWPWVFSAALLWVPAEFALGHFLHLQNDHRQTLSNLNLLLSYPMLALFALSLITGVVHHSQSRGE
ncbi:MAG: hypothetical protein WBX09_12575 [Terracidiphilus sp.]